MTILLVSAFRVHTNTKTNMKELILGIVLRIARIHTENLSITPKEKRKKSAAPLCCLLMEIE